MFRTIVVVGSLAIVAAACGGKSPPPQTAREEVKAEPATAEPGASVAPAGDFAVVAIARMREYKADLCACADATCAEDVQKKLMDWAVAHMEDIKEFEPTPEQEAEADKIEEELAVCEARFEGVAPPPPSAGSKPTAEAVTVEEILAKMSSFKDVVCKCKDKACLEKAEKEMMEWMMSHMESFKDIRPTKAQDEAADKIEDDVDACKERINGTP